MYNKSTNNSRFIAFTFEEQQARNAEPKEMQHLCLESVLREISIKIADTKLQTMKQKTYVQIWIGDHQIQTYKLYS